jgi:hypothetical protein
MRAAARVRSATPLVADRELVVTVRVWQAYSCNNSSNYRLIARFADAETAKDVARELTAFLSAHATELDDRGDYSEEPSQAQRDLAAKYGFAVSEPMHWGDDVLGGNEPDVIVHDKVLIVHHNYCGGGFGEGIPAYLAARGARTEPESSSDLSVAVLFRYTPGANPQLDTELAEMFSELELGNPNEYGEVSVDRVRGAWAGDYESYGNIAFFRDRGAVGLAFPLDPRDLENVTAWLAERGVENPSLQIDVPGVSRTFAAIARARCKSCDGRLDYLDPRIHDIEARQFVCKPCGGLYELAVFLPP